MSLITKYFSFTTIVLCFACLCTPFVSAQTSADIVLYGAKAPVKSGNWLVVNDATAAGGSSLLNPDAGAPKVIYPAANPTNFFEMNFRAEAGLAYHLWIRAKAQKNSPYNDSVFVQFSGSVDGSGTPTYRIGTGSAAGVNLEDCKGCGLSGWGWQDNGWGDMGPDIHFATSGSQTIRIQTREDGLSIDQIVLSPQTYVSSAPGSLKNNATILASNDGASLNQPPQVDITAQVVSSSLNTSSFASAAVTSGVMGTAPLLVNFMANANDPDGAVVGYSWDFGDGQTSNLVSTSHTFQAAGSYTVRLTVTDNFGSTASDAVNVTVSAPTGKTPLKILSWNIEKSRGTDEIPSLDRTATWIARLNPDIVALCEVMRTSSDNQPQRLLDMLKQKTGVAWYGHWFAKYQGCSEGNLILSKIPFTSTSGKYLSHERSVAQASFSIGGRTINFFATHLSVESATYRAAQISELLNWTSGFSDERIICGDFNASYTTSEIGAVTPSYYDGWAMAVSNKTATAYADNPVGVGTRTRRGRIDYIFFSRSSANLVLKSMWIPDSRDLSNPNVVNKLGTLDDKGVRPSDHNQSLATFEIR